MAMMDMEFEKLKPLMPHVALNTMATREHAGEIERKIRVIKERARGTFNTLPYKKLPRMMVIELLHFCVMWMNSLGQIGCLTTMGKGAAISSSNIMKCNTRSSTETARYYMDEIFC